MLATDDKVKEGSVPAYTGETPAKHHDTAGYYYAFSGWSPEVVEATEDTSYTAQFTECTNEPVNYVNAKGEAQPAITEYEAVIADMPDYTLPRPASLPARESAAEEMHTEPSP